LIWQTHESSRCLYPQFRSHTTDEDEAVSPSTNTKLFEKMIKERNGKITVIYKPGFKHHPHNLSDSTPIVDFIMSAINVSK